MQPHDYTPYSWLDDDNNDDHGHDNTTRLVFRHHGGSEDKASDSEYLRTHEIGRPLHNIERKKREQEDMVVSVDGLVVDREYISPI